MCSSCDSSIYYETTYSQDQRIETIRHAEQEVSLVMEELDQQKRKLLFDKAFSLKKDTIFELHGLKILTFTSSKIKFSFEPSKVVEHVSKKVIFYCSLRYLVKYGSWIIKRDSFPANYKWRIYPIFYDGMYFAVDDRRLSEAILRIYKQLVIWAQEEEEFRLAKFSRYINGDDVYLDTDDEEIFLNDEQRAERYEKRRAVLLRMIPPNKRPKRRKRILQPSSDYF